jgi:hypothetical protein
MSDAYMKASDDGKLPAEARQIYYAARGKILDRMEKNELDAQYFCYIQVSLIMTDRPSLWFQ